MDKHWRCADCGVPLDSKDLRDIGFIGLQNDGNSQHSTSRHQHVMDTSEIDDKPRTNSKSRNVYRKLIDNVTSPWKQSSKHQEAVRTQSLDRHAHHRVSRQATTLSSKSLSSRTPPSVVSRTQRSSPVCFSSPSSPSSEPRGEGVGVWVPNSDRSHLSSSISRCKTSQRGISTMSSFRSDVTENSQRSNQIDRNTRASCSSRYDEHSVNDCHQSSNKTGRLSCTESGSDLYSPATRARDLEQKVEPSTRESEKKDRFRVVSSFTDKTSSRTGERGESFLLKAISSVPMLRGKTPSGANTQTISSNFSRKDKTSDFSSLNSNEQRKMKAINCKADSNRKSEIHDIGRSSSFNRGYNESSSKINSINSVDNEEEINAMFHTEPRTGGPNSLTLVAMLPFLGAKRKSGTINIIQPDAILKNDGNTIEAVVEPFRDNDIYVQDSGTMTTGFSKAQNTSETLQLRSGKKETCIDEDYSSQNMNLSLKNLNRDEIIHRDYNEEETLQWKIDLMNRHAHRVTSDDVTNIAAIAGDECESDQMSSVSCRHGAEDTPTNCSMDMERSFEDNLEEALGDNLGVSSDESYDDGDSDERRQVRIRDCDQIIDDHLNGLIDHIPIDSSSENLQRMYLSGVTALRNSKGFVERSKQGEITVTPGNNENSVPNSSSAISHGQSQYVGISFKTSRSNMSKAEPKLAVLQRTSLSDSSRLDDDYENRHGMHCNVHAVKDLIDGTCPSAADISISANPEQSSFGNSPASYISFMDSTENRRSKSPNIDPVKMKTADNRNIESRTKVTSNFIVEDSKIHDIHRNYEEEKNKNVSAINPSSDSRTWNFRNVIHTNVDYLQNESGKGSTAPYPITGSRVAESHYRCSAERESRIRVNESGSNGTALLKPSDNIIRLSSGGMSALEERESNNCAHLKENGSNPTYSSVNKVCMGEGEERNRITATESETSKTNDSSVRRLNIASKLEDKYCALNRNLDATLEDINDNSAAVISELRNKLKHVGDGSNQHQENCELSNGYSKDRSEIFHSHQQPGAEFKRRYKFIKQPSNTESDNDRCVTPVLRCSCELRKDTDAYRFVCKDSVKRIIDMTWKQLTGSINKSSTPAASSDILRLLEKAKSDIENDLNRLRCQNVEKLAYSNQCYHKLRNFVLHNNYSTDTDVQVRKYVVSRRSHSETKAVDLIGENSSREEVHIESFLSSSKFDEGGRHLRPVSTHPEDPSEVNVVILRDGITIEGIHVKRTAENEQNNSNEITLQPCEVDYELLFPLWTRGNGLHGSNEEVDGNSKGADGFPPPPDEWTVQ